MGYEYSDPTRANDAHALRDVEVFERHFKLVAHCDRCAFDDERDNEEPLRCELISHEWICEGCAHRVAFDCLGDDCHNDSGFYFAFGFPGCPWGGEPGGPYPTYQDALEAAREWSE